MDVPFCLPQTHCSLESGWLAAVTATVCKDLYLESTAKALANDTAGEPGGDRGSDVERQSLAITAAALWVLGGGITTFGTGSRVEVRAQRVITPLQRVLRAFGPFPRRFLCC